MGWATNYIRALALGHTVRMRPRGNSMLPLIHSGDHCTVARVDESEELTIGDVVLCTVKGRQFLHLIKAVDSERYLIGNNRGGINGWIRRTAVHGRLVSVERKH